MPVVIENSLDLSIWVSGRAGSTCPVIVPGVGCPSLARRVLQQASTSWDDGLPRPATHPVGFGHREPIRKGLGGKAKFRNQRDKLQGKGAGIAAAKTRSSLVNAGAVKS